MNELPLNAEPVAMADVLGPKPIPDETECGYGGTCRRAAASRVQVDFAGTRYVGFSCQEHNTRAELALRAHLQMRMKNGNLP